MRGTESRRTSAGNDSSGYNIISDVFAQKPSERVHAWLNAQESGSLFLSTAVLAELYYGAFLVPESLRQELLLQNIGKVISEFEGRVLSFGETASEMYGRITAARRQSGRPMETKDAMIASICIVHGAMLATRNVRDFEELDLKLVNPFETGGLSRRGDWRAKLG